MNLSTIQIEPIAKANFGGMVALDILTILSGIIGPSCTITMSKEQEPEFVSYVVTML